MPLTISTSYVAPGVAVPGSSVRLRAHAGGMFTTFSASYCSDRAALIGEPIVCCMARTSSFMPL